MNVADPRSPPRRWTWPLVAVVTYTAGALALTWPTALHLRSHLLGGLRSDACTHVWTLWWAATALVERGALIPSHTNLIQYPGGGRLVSPSPLHDLLSAPVTLTAGPIAAYNLVMLANLVLAAYGAFALARYLLRDPRPALMAGAVFGLCPFLLTYAVASGGTELVAVGWLPLAILWLLRTLREDSLRPAVMTGLCLAAMELTCLYYLAVFGLVAATLVSHQLILGRRSGWDLVAVARDATTPTVPGRRVAARLALALAVAAAIAGPHVALLVQTLRAPDSVLSTRVTELDRSPTDLTQTPGFDAMAARGAAHHIVSEETFGVPGDGTEPFIDPAYAQSYSSVFLVDLLRPGPRPPRQLDIVSRFLLDPYVGVTTLLLVLVGLVMNPRRDRWVWLGVALGSLLIAMGPFLMVSHDIHLVLPRSPLHWLLSTLYPLHPPGHDASYFVATMLALAVLAAHGTASVLAVLPRRVAVAAPLALVALFTAEVRWVSAGPHPLPLDEVPHHECHADLALDPGAPALLELPLFIDGALLTRRETFCHQIVHGLPLAQSISGYQPAALRDNPLITALIDIERGGQGAGVSDEGLRDGLRQLREARLGAIVVDGSSYPDADTRARARAVLDGLLGQPRTYDTGYLVYRIDP